MLTPDFVGVRLQLDPDFVATTLSLPMLISTWSAFALGVTVTLAFASLEATVGFSGVASLATGAVALLSSLNQEPRSRGLPSFTLLFTSITVSALNLSVPILLTPDL